MRDVQLLITLSLLRSDIANGMMDNLEIALTVRCHSTCDFSATEGLLLLKENCCFCSSDVLLHSILDYN